MFKFIPYILKTLWRHRSRTGLTVAGTAVALFVFCFVITVQQSMDDLHHRAEASRSLVVFQANKFCPATSHLPQDYSQRIGRIEGVRDVVPIQVFTNNCRASLDVVVFYGVPPKQLQAVRDFRLLSGTWPEFENHQDAAVVGRTFAERRGIKTGEKFSIGDLSVVVAGIYESDDPAEENYIYSHLDFLQRGKGRNLVGTVTQLEVLLDDRADSTAVCKEVDTMFKAGPVETVTRPKGAFQAQSLGDLSQLISMARYLGYACVGLVLALVATTTVMSVQDRIKEHAVLRTIGFSSLRVFRLVLTESVLLSVVGGLIGVVAAVLVLEFGSLSVGADAVAVAFGPSARMVMTGILVALLAGFLAGLAPAWHAARTEIVSALRQP
ncbi:MAG: ABC transporter permease [Pirellulales bacterium]|nr:ABC transporter permease [Pirellulales bacterium]